LSRLRGLGRRAPVTPLAWEGAGRSRQPAKAPGRSTVSSAGESTAAAPAGEPSGTPRPTAPQRARDAERAGAGFRSFVDAYYVEAAGLGFFTHDRSSRRLASFWTSAELIELVEDRCEGSADPSARRMVDALLRGFVVRFGRDWTSHNRYNDDIMWAVIAAARAFRVTGDPSYRDLAKANFDRAFARAWSADFGGGLWWTTARHEKNACVNAPAAISAAFLYQALREPAYLDKAEQLFAWLRGRLFDHASGRVDDHIALSSGSAGGRGTGTHASDGGDIDHRAFTYNQGTFIGAADMLHRITGEPAYREDALRALAFAERELAPAGILRSEGDGGDGGGFKGIFARYAVGFARREALEECESWLRRNADAAWGRRDGLGLVGQDWARGAAAGQAAPAAVAGGPAAWDASSAVVLLQALSGGP
jgi:predicted alpha-1,6-mannanase (GH76 family)